MHDYVCAAPLWSAQTDPSVIRARAHACNANEAYRVEIDRYEHRAVVGPYAEHVLLRTRDASLRLDIIEGTVLAGPVVLEPGINLSSLDGQIASIRKLHALLRGVALPKDLDCRLPRLLLALRVLDARAEGASLRDLACDILNARDWPGDGDNIKSRVRRLVALSDKLRRAGPRGVLAYQV